MKSEQNRQEILIKKKISKIKEVKRQCFQYVFGHIHFFNMLLIRVVGTVENL